MAVLMYSDGPVMSHYRPNLLAMSICQTCLLIIANGETGEPFDANRWEHGVTRKWGGFPVVTLGGEEEGFCTTECDHCGDTLHGDRFVAYVQTD